jgi:hypothetical protein
MTDGGIGLLATPDARGPQTMFSACMVIQATAHALTWKLCHRPRGLHRPGPLPTPTRFAVRVRRQVGTSWHSPLYIGVVRGSAAVLAVWLVGCTTPATADCPVSPTGVIVTTRTGGERVFHWSGDLAAPADIWANNGTKGQIWIYRTNEPTSFMRLLGERADGRKEVSFEVFRVTVQAPPIRFPGGGQGYVYAMASSEAVFRDAGCWRVRVDGTAVNEAVVVRIR